VPAPKVNWNKSKSDASAVVRKT